MLASLLAFAFQAVATETVTVDRIEWQRIAVDTDEGRTAVTEKYGIELQPLRLTLADNMIDLRWRVVDPEKAAVLHGGKLKTYVLEPSGNFWSKVTTGKVGSLRQTKRAPKKDVIYTTMLNNPGRHFKRGQKVNVAVGEVMFENLTIE